MLTHYKALITSFQTTSHPSSDSTQIADQVKHIINEYHHLDMDYILQDASELIEESKEGVERIKKIVMDLKDFAHPGVDEMKLTDINRNIDSTLNIVWNEIKYKALVKKDYGDLPQVKCYPQQLNQVFMNILINAAQAVRAKGVICISTFAENGRVLIRISDTGEGIPKENIPKIFDPFFTTKEVGKGTGLGMNVVYNIIKKHNGTIDVDSEIGKGSTFTIQIPIDQVFAND
jgi:signal transduction histidine kinase